MTLGMYIRYASQYIRENTQDGNLCTRKRRTEEYELEYIQDNSGVSYVDGREIRHQPGTVLLVHPGQERYTRGAFVCYAVHFMPDTDGAEYSMLDSLPLVFMPVRPPYFRRLFFDVCTKYTKNQNSLPTECDTQFRVSQVSRVALVWHLIAELCRENEQQYRIPAPYRRHADALYTVREYMLSHCEETISLQRMADMVHLSPAFFHRVFHASYGVTLNDMLRDIRLCRAEDMLTNSDSSYREIAEKCGFSSQAYMSYVFRHVRGVTPGTYRMEQTRF